MMDLKRFTMYRMVNTMKHKGSNPLIFLETFRLIQSKKYALTLSFP